MDISHNPFLLLASSSARFAARRTIAKAKRPPKIETIIVDIDRTLTNEDSAKLALERVYGKERAHERLAGFARKIKRREMAFDQLHTAIFTDIYDMGFKQDDWVVVMEKLKISGGFRRDLADALHKIGADHDIDLVLATRGSDISARYVAESLGFSHALGSIERWDGKDFTGFHTIIGADDSENRGTRIMTKITAVSKLLGSIGKSVDPKTSAILTNDLLDTLEMLRSACGILLRPRDPNSLERMTQRLGLYDRTIDEGKDYQVQLASALGLGPGR